MALMQLAERLPKHPALMLLIGFLAARLPRVHFTLPSLLPEDAEVRVAITTPQARIWTGRWFRAWLGQAAVPDPVVLVSALTERDVDIYLSVDFGPAVPEWYEAAVSGALAPVEQAPTDRLEDLRRRVDHALDIYNECRRMLEAGDAEREKELQFLLELARQEVEALGAELRRLKEELPASP